MVKWHGRDIDNSMDVSIVATPAESPEHNVFAESTRRHCFAKMQVGSSHNMTFVIACIA